MKNVYATSATEYLGGSSYIALYDNNILTLQNINFEAELYAPDDLTINLVGNNYISSLRTAGNGDITIQGTGSLNVENASTSPTINAGGNLTITDGAKITATDNGYNTQAIAADNIYISGDGTTVRTQSANNAIYARNNFITVSDGAKLTATAADGTVFVSNSNNSYITADGCTIKVGNSAPGSLWDGQSSLWEYKYINIVPAIDTSQLKTFIAAANDLYNSTFESIDGADVSKNNRWATAEKRQEFKTVIDQAQDMVANIESDNSEDYNADDVAAMVIQLDEATVIYTNWLAYGTAQDIHTHTWQTEWASNSTHHWHECQNDCTFDSDSEKGEYGEHSWTDDLDTDCNDCGYVRTVESGHTHTWKTEWANNSTHHWHECQNDCTFDSDSEKGEYGEHSWTDDLDTDCNDCGYVRTVDNDSDNDDSDDNTGNIINDKEDEKGNIGNAGLCMSNEDLKNNILTEDDIAALEAGKNIKVWLKVVDGKNTVSDKEKEETQTLLEENDEYTHGMYLDISLFKQIGDEDTQAISNTNDKVKVQFELPEVLRAAEGSKRTYKIVRVHKVSSDVYDTELLDCDYNTEKNIISFETDKFSSYSVVYTETADDNSTTSKKSRRSSKSHEFEEKNYKFWETAEKQIEEAKSGDVLKINANGYKKINAEAMEAIYNSEGLTVEIHGWKKSFTITSETALKPEHNRLFYRFDDLCSYYGEN
ncbi:MAG: hypothetical protein IKV41_07500 [Oscillospiraceae bacterium]|nr:hypothetical protein [Oscillospiraceae bacterium]